jgi:hypothetical protein
MMDGARAGWGRLSIGGFFACMGARCVVVVGGDSFISSPTRCSYFVARKTPSQ